MPKPTAPAAVPAEPLPANLQRYRLAAALVVLLVLLAISLFQWQLWISQSEERTHVRADTDRRGTQLVSAVASRMGVMVRGVDFALLQLRRDPALDEAQFRALS